jgi:hypothetical protein
MSAPFISFELVAPYGTLVNCVVSDWPRGDNTMAEFTNIRVTHACLLKPTPEVSVSLLPLTAGAPGVLLPAEGGSGKLRVTGETRGDRT